MVKVVGVYKEYRRDGSRVPALQNVSLEVFEGEFCAVVGPSGCGKSTLLGLIGGIDWPTQGDIILNGRSTRNFGDDEWTRIRRHEIGFVFQAFHLVPGLSAGENVALPLLIGGVRASEVWRRVEETLEWVNLRDRRDHRPGELSGGEQQRVAIARALVHRPRLILADEPTGNLDSVNGAEVITMLKALPSQSGQTVILVTHSEAAADRADSLFSMKDGRVTGMMRPVLSGRQLA